MKKLWALLALCLLLSACGGAPDAPAPEEDGGTSGAVFTYNGREYDLARRQEGVNAVMGQTPVGRMLVVEGHISPHAAYYGIFDTETEDFAKDIVGVNLTWRDDDITTAVYNFWSDIYDYEGNLLGTLDLAQGEYIRALTWTGSGRLSAEVCSGDGSVTLELDIPASGGT